MPSPLLEHDQILDYIPQRAPIVMVDKLYRVEVDYTQTGLTVKPSNIFVRDGLLTSMGLIEHLAQSAALGAGYLFVQNNMDVQVGFIGAIKNLQIDNWPKIGADLFTEIRETHHISNIKIIKGQVRCQNEVICSCEMKIFF